jgi:hypothetical protein
VVVARAQLWLAGTCTTYEVSANIDITHSVGLKPPEGTAMLAAAAARLLL